MNIRVLSIITAAALALGTFSACAVGIKGNEKKIVDSGENYTFTAEGEAGATYHVTLSLNGDLLYSNTFTMAEGDTELRYAEDKLTEGGIYELKVWKDGDPEADSPAAVFARNAESLNFDELFGDETTTVSVPENLPYGAVFMLDGEEVSADEEKTLAEGTHQLKAYYEGFEDVIDAWEKELKVVAPEEEVPPTAVQSEGNTVVITGEPDKEVEWKIESVSKQETLDADGKVVVDLTEYVGRMLKEGVPLDFNVKYNGGEKQNKIKVTLSNQQEIPGTPEVSEEPVIKDDVVDIGGLLAGNESEEGNPAEDTLSTEEDSEASDVASAEELPSIEFNTNFDNCAVELIVSVTDDESGVYGVFVEGKIVYSYMTSASAPTIKLFMQDDTEKGKELSESFEVKEIEDVCVELEKEETDKMISEYGIDPTDSIGFHIATSMTLKKEIETLPAGSKVFVKVFWKKDNGRAASEERKSKILTIPVIE